MFSCLKLFPTSYLRPLSTDNIFRLKMCIYSAHIAIYVWQLVYYRFMPCNIQRPAASRCILNMCLFEWTYGFLVDEKNLWLLGRCKEFHDSNSNNFTNIYNARGHPAFDRVSAWVNNYHPTSSNIQCTICVLYFLACRWIPPRRLIKLLNTENTSSRSLLQITLHAKSVFDKKLFKNELLFNATYI